MKNKLITLSLAVMLLASCSGSDSTEVIEPVTPPVPHKQIPINISPAMWTRATDTEFENGDKTGIYVVNYKDGAAQNLQTSGNHVDNMCFTYNGSWEAATPIYWLDAVTHADFYCYYPYSSAVTDVNSYKFTVKADQSAEAEYKASDFMWAKRGNVAPTPDAVQINVRHSMSKLIVKLKAGKGYKAEDMAAAKVSICGLKNNANINLTTGIATAEGAEAVMTPMKLTDSYKALVVPQTVTNESLIKVEIGGQTYALNVSMTFEANKQHTCTVTVNKINGGINIGIDGWETDDVDHGGVAE